MPSITDPRHAPSNPLDAVFARLIRDVRDVSLARVSVLLVPTGLFLVALNYAAFSWWSVALYAVYYVWFMGPCTLGMHNIAHRPMFKKRRWDNVLIAAMGAFFGHAPGTYPGHHLSMHHREENGPEDASSTLPYQRDSVVHFGRYVGRFLTLGLVDLGSYLARKKRAKPLKEVLVGELGWYVMLALLLLLDPLPTLAVFVAPTLATRFFLMAGNWAQHAFIDPDDWANPYRSVTTFVNSGYNNRCFNDGYHLNHHLRSSLHWTELPEKFELIRDQVIEQDAIVFRKIDYFMIWVLLMLRRYRTLANYMVQFGEERTVEERVALLRHRLQPIHVAATS